MLLTFKTKLILPLLALCLWAPCIQAIPLFAISGDDIGVPRRLNYIDTDTAIVKPLFDLGDGTLGYAGLTFINDQFYTVANDSNGVSTLHSFSLTDVGTTNSIFALGQGFFGGIAAQSNNQFYALANNPIGASELYSIDLSLSSSTLIDPNLGFGLAGGLTWNQDTNLLYALGTDSSFIQTLFSIDPNSPGSSTVASNPLGSGIIGGVDYAGSEGYFAIGNEQLNSELLSVSLGGNSSSQFQLSPFPSFTFSALTSGPEITVEPEPMPVPASAWLILPSLLILARQLQRKSNQTGTLKD